VIVAAVDSVNCCRLQGPVATFVTWSSHTRSRYLSMKTWPSSGLLRWLHLRFRSKLVPSS